MKCAFIVLTLNALCAFTTSQHEIIYIVGCFVNGTTEVQFEFDGDEILYVDLQKEEVVYTMPASLDPDPSRFLAGLAVLRDALDNMRLCQWLMALAAAEEKNPPEETEAPESVLFSTEEVELGVENSLICFVNHFYPPAIVVSWTKNGLPVSEGVSLSRYFPSNDQTFHQFSTLTFTPSEGDIYSCTVEHAALERPKTRFWEHDFNHPSDVPDVLCGVGLALGLLGIATGTFFIVKAHGQ